MLAIRMQRTGRKGHAMFRVVVQDSRLTPGSGKFVALLGNYDPHAKTVHMDKEKAAFYLQHGAQPSERAARLLQNEGVKLPAWVSVAGGKARTTRHPEKLRRNQPEPAAETKAETEAVPDNAEEEAPEAESASESAD